MADPTSILGNLAQRREEIAAAQKLTLEIPRWTPPIFVTYNLLTVEAATRIWGRLNKTKKPSDAQRLDANIDILVHTCDSVFVLIDNEKVSLGGNGDGELTRFDEELAEALELQNKTAREVVRTIFIAQGDILQHVKQVSEWSGLGGEELAEEYEGE